jgi:hypothetical protein
MDIALLVRSMIEDLVRAVQQASRTQYRFQHGFLNGER